MVLRRLVGQDYRRHEAAEVVRALHQTEADDLAEFISPEESWPSLLRRKPDENIRELMAGGLLAAPALRELEAMVAVEAARLAEAPLVLVHGDLHEDHVLLSKWGGSWAITCLIDWGDARLAPREYEWPPVWSRMSRKFLTSRARPPSRALPVIMALRQALCSSVWYV